MRRWFVILMIFLLPLRAWAGGVMLTSMADQPTSAHAQAAAPCHPVAADAVQVAHHAGDESQVAAPHGSHLLCDICNGPALAAVSPASVAIGQLGTPVPVASIPFLSAWPNRDSRPPIA